MRYVVTMSAYLWADDDEQAKRLAERYAEHMRELCDNHASADALYEQNFGTLTNRKITM